MRSWRVRIKKKFSTKVGIKIKFCFLRITASNAIIFANTDNSFNTVLKLLNTNELAGQQYINEHPIMTALARHQDASRELIQKFKAYIQSKGSDFIYLKKTYLIYSSLVKSYCKNNECSQATLVRFLNKLKLFKIL